MQVHIDKYPTKGNKLNQYLIIRSVTLLIFIGAVLLSKTAHSQVKDTVNDAYDSVPVVASNDTIPMVDNLKYSIDSLVRGYIIFPSNKRQFGLLRFNGKKVIFRDSVSQKKIRYEAGEIIGFVALKDTFKVIADTGWTVPNPRDPLASVSKMIVDNIFVKEMIYGPKVCLYKTVIKQTSPGMMMGGTMVPGISMVNIPSAGITAGAPILTSVLWKNVFYLKRANEIKYTKIPERQRPLKKLLDTYLKDDRDLLKSINADLLKFDSIDFIVNNYNKKYDAR